MTPDLMDGDDPAYWRERWEASELMLAHERERRRDAEAVAVLALSVVERGRGEHG